MLEECVGTRRSQARAAAKRGTLCRGGGMATMSFATIDVVYLLICCQTKQNKSLARTVTVRVRAKPGEGAGLG